MKTAHLLTDEKFLVEIINEDKKYVSFKVLSLGSTTTKNYIVGQEKKMIASVFYSDFIINE